MNLRAEVTTDKAIAPELYHFAEVNYMPKWQACADAPPYPTLADIESYFDKGHIVVVCRDLDDGSMKAWRIHDKDTNTPVWFAVQKGPENGQGDVARDDAVEWVAHLWAAYWVYRGGVLRPPAPDNPLLLEAQQRTQTLADQIYVAQYQ